MKDTITIDDLEEAIAEKLDSYKTSVSKNVLKETKAAAQKLVCLTKKRAPVEITRKRTKKKRKPGTFAKSITSKVEDNGVFGAKGIWYVKGDEYRLTHLLVHGHQLRQGGRAKGNSFVEDSLNEVADEYVKKLAEAVEEK